MSMAFWEHPQLVVALGIVRKIVRICMDTMHFSQVNARLNHWDHVRHEGQGRAVWCCSCLRKTFHEEEREVESNVPEGGGV